MSLLSSFITNQLIKSLESEFISHEPELKDAFVQEVATAVADVVAWVNSKISTSQPVEAQK
jgi:hypothetical protein